MDSLTQAQKTPRLKYLLLAFTALLLVWFTLAAVSMAGDTATVLQRVLSHPI